MHYALGDCSDGEIHRAITGGLQADIVGQMSDVSRVPPHY